MTTWPAVMAVLRMGCSMRRRHRSFHKWRSSNLAEDGLYNRPKAVGRHVQVKRGEDKGWENIYQVEDDISCLGLSGESIFHLNRRAWSHGAGPDLWLENGLRGPSRCLSLGTPRPKADTWSIAWVHASSMRAFDG